MAEHTGRIRIDVGLERVPTAELRAELGRRLPPTELPLLPDKRYADLLAISYELDLGDDTDQDVAHAVRLALTDAGIHGDVTTSDGPPR